MSRLTYWYSGLSRGAKTALTIGGIALAVVAAVAILYLVLTPEKVEVRYGTIVWDPIDGHVWEDNTQTILVEASEAGNYRVERIEKLSPEHEEQQAQLRAELEKEREEQEQAGAFGSIESAFPSDTFEQLNALQQNIETAGQDIISGMEMANQIYVAQIDPHRLPQPGGFPGITAGTGGRKDAGTPGTGHVYQRVRSSTLTPSPVATSAW